MLVAQENIEIKGKRKLEFRREFGGDNEEQSISWERRDAVITDAQGNKVFEQRNVEFPADWSQSAVNIVASKYFHGDLAGEERESSLKEMSHRVVDAITTWGWDDCYFADDVSREAFRADLLHLIWHQKASFNSPVWFNCGIEEEPQCSACFINSVEDTMDSILTLARTEGMLFKWGSGTGTNLSPIRASGEKLSSGGIASGPVSFMKGYDSFAGVIRSGGKTRRSAKMVILDVDHPDIEEFIECKAKEERKAWALIDAGYDDDLNGEAYSSVQYQNANHSVRVSDDFMQAVVDGDEWLTHEVSTGRMRDSYRAKDLFRKMAVAAHACGDPGIQFDDTINAWHTSPASGRINASNPCSEYMYLDDSACNLASLNLLKFVEGGSFDAAKFEHAVNIMITAMDIIVGHASYPTEKIMLNSHRFRPLGLGYANLGALLMHQGLPYDSDAGRSYAAGITALMTGSAYRQSARIAKAVAPFDGFYENIVQFVSVMEKHRNAIPDSDDALFFRAAEVWDEAISEGRLTGFRNGQATVLAPTGTIGLMMDCDTTGVEPDLSLVKTKKLVGGGEMSIVNQTVHAALSRLGYAAEQVEAIRRHIAEHGHVEGAADIAEEHVPIFDCSLKTVTGTRTIHHEGHLKMMGAVQPFLSGAISKTVNMPADCSVGDVESAYLFAWRLGLKSVAIYRDGSKRVQPLNKGKLLAEDRADKKQVRSLPAVRDAIIHKFVIAGHTGYLTVGLSGQGQPREIFLSMSKQGSFISGLIDAFARSVSYNLQYGVPLELLVSKYSHTRYEPSGYTENPDIRYADSITDYVFRWLGQRFLGAAKDGIADEAVVAVEERGANGRAAGSFDAPPCASCGAVMVRSGTCFKCLNCGSTSGCS